MSSSDSSVMIARLFPFLLLLLPSFIWERDEDATEGALGVWAGGGHDAIKSSGSASAAGTGLGISGIGGLHLGQYQSPGGASSSGGSRQSVCQPRRYERHYLWISHNTYRCRKNHRAIDDSTGPIRGMPSRNKDRQTYITVLLQTRLARSTDHTLPIVRLYSFLRVGEIQAR